MTSKEEGFEDLANQLTRNLLKAHDEYLLRFFGSEENVKKFAHLYVLEIGNAEMKLDASGTDNLYRLEQYYRLRLKTDEELALEREKKASPYIYRDVYTPNNEEKR